MDNKKELTNGLRNRFLPKAYYLTPIIFALLYVPTLILLSYLIDIQGGNIFGLGDWISEQTNSFSLFWIHFFKEGSYTEVLQWTFLGISIVVSTFLGIAKYRKHSKVPVIFVLLVVGLFLMLLEDIVDLRHIISDMMGYYFFDADPFGLEWKMSTQRLIIELVFYVLLGSIMVISLIYILLDKDNSPTGKKLFFSGCSFYALAAVFSATRNIGSWYSIVGTRFLNTFIKGNEVGWSGDTVVYGVKPLGFWFMDLVVEESLELIAVTLLLGGLLAFLLAGKKECFAGVDNRSAFLNIALMVILVIFFSAFYLRLVDCILQMLIPIVIELL